MDAPSAARHRPLRRIVLASLTLACFSLLRGATAEELAAFTDRHCSSCHNDVDKEGGLDLTSLSFAPNDPANFVTWVKVHDRVQAGEMPPPEKKRPAATELNGFVQTLGASLTAADRAAVARDGRARQRRLNRSEYENAVRDLFQAPWLEVKSKLPEDGESSRFNKSSDALSVSFVHMKQYMNAAENAIAAVLAVELVRPETTRKRYYARETPGLTVFNPSEQLLGHPERMKFPVFDRSAQPDVIRHKAPLTVGESDPAKRELEAVGWVASNYEAFPTTWTTFRAPVTGRYRVRFSGYTLWVGSNGSPRGPEWDGMDAIARTRSDVTKWYHANYDNVSPGRRNEPIHVYSRGLTGVRLGTFDLTPEPAVYDLGEVWLLGSQMFTTDSVRLFRSRPVPTRGWTNPLAQRDGVPAVAFRWMEVEGPLYDESSRAGYRLLFGDLPLKKVADDAPGIAMQIVNQGTGGRRGGAPGRGFAALASANVEVETANPAADGEKLLRAFLPRAFRRPVEEKEVQRYVALFNECLKTGVGFASAMRAAYTAVLASPDFVFVHEAKGRLDDHALATRLALFLWNSTPDERLRQLAQRGELHQADVLRAETERLLGDPKASRFTSAFLDYWLDLRKMDDSTPSETLYNDYYLDDALAEAAVDESRLFFAELLQQDLPAANVVDSDFTILNERLADHYGIPGVEGVAMRPVSLPAGSPRGGFMTQASVLKVTANGTTTSPVVRGKWIMERIVGFTMPLPPASVPAVEPDLRGAVTIRQQLDKHRADESCAMCHRKIDPAGFALENFDVMGGWRDRYRSSSPTELYDTIGRFGKNGAPLTFRLALPVDPAGQLADGREFTDIRDLKRLLLQDEAQIARNLTRQLLIFATGSAQRFSDREIVEQIVQGTRGRRYGVRSLIHGLIQSELFLQK
jgi:hypothetical protein